MKRFLLIAFVLVLIYIGCAKEKGCMPVKPEAEQETILSYANAVGIDSLKHNSGIYYKIIDPGTGKTPAKNSTVSVMYWGKFLNGAKFDESTTPTAINLANVIEGWQIGIPLIKKGGKIQLIIPSSYGYGCNAVTDRNNNVVIPANSVLYFDVSLIDVY